VLGPALAQRLRLEGFATLLCATGAEAAEKVPKARPDALLCDIRLPDVSGEDLFRRLLPDLGSATVLFMTAFGDIGQAIRLTRAGADDYLAKPFDTEALIARLRARLRPRAGKAVRGADDPASPAMRRALDVLRRAARVDSPVLLTGETGVGKEVAARLLHAEGPAAGRPFVAVNCAAIPDRLADSQLFGHEKGSFTGAADRHAGVFEEAADGTLFLDEVGELPPPLQAKLLRVLEERRFRRVGGTADLPFRARLVSATNADLETAAAEGRFRRDLLFRLDVIGVRIPSLRERAEEIGPLIARFAADCAARFGLPGPAPRPTGGALAAAAAHDWPGNVRELRNRVERAVALAAGPWIEASDLFPERRLSADGDETPTLARVREEAERRHIAAVLARTGGAVREAAALLGVSRTTLWEKMRRYGLGADGGG